MDRQDLADVEVLILHPHGALWVPLTEWIRKEPGPRPYLAPCAARRRGTNENLPLDVVPLQYRNTRESREMIRQGKLADPWPD